MQPTMPRTLSVHSEHVSIYGRLTSLVHKGYMYKDGECTWELLAPVEFLAQEHSVQPCIYWLRPHFGPLL